MAALPPTAGGSSDQLPDTHSPSRSVKSVTAATAATAPDLATAKVVARESRRSSGTFKGSPRPPRLDDDKRAISERGSERQRRTMAAVGRCVRGREGGSRGSKDGGNWG